MKKSDLALLQNIPVHLASFCSFAAIHCHCGAAMQAQDNDRWSSNIWSNRGAKRHRRIHLMTFDRELATCRQCLKALDKAEGAAKG